MLKLAQHILETKEADFDPSQFVDHYEEAVVEMLKKKQAGMATPKGKASEPPRNVINLMDALKKSIADKGARPQAKKGKKADREGSVKCCCRLPARRARKPPSRRHGRQRDGKQAKASG